MNEARPGYGAQGPNHPPQQPHHPAQPPLSSQPRPAAVAPHAPAAPAAPHAHPTFRAAVTGVLPTKAPPAEETSSLELVEVEPDAPAGTATATEAPKSKIHAFSVLGVSQKQHDWKRPTVNTEKGPCRVRSFHGRLSEQGLEYLDHAVNEWLDRHPDVDVKMVTSTVGQFDGKIKEPALILNVWY
jgi:hypothetical protein